MTCYSYYLRCFVYLVLLFIFCGLGKTSYASDVILHCTTLTGTQPNVTCNFPSKTITSVLQYRTGIYPANPSTCTTGGGTGTIASFPVASKGPCPDLSYWVKIIVGGTNYILQWYYIGGQWLESGVSYIPTSIYTLTIATSTQTVNITGYINATTTSGISERLFIYQNGLITGYNDLLTDSYPLLQSMFTATSTGAFNFTVPYKVLSTSTATTTTPITSTSTIQAFIYQYDNNYGNDPFTGLADYRYKTLLVSTSTTIGSYTGYKIDNIQDLDLYPEYECSITSITGCLKNAFIWSFYPTQDVIDKYYVFIDTFQSKAPFGYASIVIRAITGINASSTPTFTINIPKTIKSIF